MSLVFNMVGGSAGGLKNTDAVLIVTVPTGSTVTATKGGTTLTPTMWVKAANASLDCAIFNIPASQFDSVNPWTVTATDGTSTASDIVFITTNKEYEIELVFGLYIVRDGEIVTTPSFANATIGAKSGDYWYFGTTDTGGHAAYIRTDVTSFTVLTATIYPKAASLKMLGMWTQTAPIATDTMSAYTDMISAATNQESTWTFDVSALTGEQTVGVRFGGYGSSFGIKELALK